MKQTKIKAKKRTPKIKQYPAYVLAIILSVFLLGEGWLGLNTTKSDWQAGASVLDVSAQVSDMVSDMEFVLAPANDTIAAINEFYHQATIAALQTFDISGTADPLAFARGVNDFYNQASDQLISVLDISNYFVSPNTPQVAGVSIQK